MAKLLGAICTSHIPAIGNAIARGKQDEPYWKPFFEGYPPIREWLAKVVVESPPARVAAFGTRQGRSFLVGSAAKSIARAAKRRALLVSDTADFAVTSREGPLEQGELERAFAWGRTLTASQ